MATTLIFLFCFIKIAASRQGFASEIFNDEKYDCPLANKKVYTVKSEIQCTHRCLNMDTCDFINYNTEEDVKQNCEILKQVNQCSTKLSRKRWIAMRFQVFTINYLNILYYVSKQLYCKNSHKVSSSLKILLKSYYRGFCSTEWYCCYGDIPYHRTLTNHITTGPFV